MLNGYKCMVSVLFNFQLSKLVDDNYNTSDYSLSKKLNWCRKRVCNKHNLISYELIYKKKINVLNDGQIGLMQR